MSEQELPGIMPPDVPPELQAMTVGFWEAQGRTVLGLAKEAADPYVSKDRLRQIAKLALLQCAALFNAQDQAEKQEAQEGAAEVVQNSGLLLPDTSIIIP